MIQVLIAIFFIIAGVLMKGLINLSFSEIIIVLSVPCVFIYKLFGNRPSFLVFAGMLGAFCGGIAGFYGYIVVPIQYFYSIWGGGGIVVGVIAAILLPINWLIFLFVAYLKGSATVYIAKFVAGVCFGLAGVLIFNGSISKSPWSWLFPRKGGNY